MHLIATTSNTSNLNLLDNSLQFFAFLLLSFLNYQNIMGRRYYCDYCDKLFIDDLEARKKHLQSSHHIKMRNLHYESCRGRNTTLFEK